MDTLLLELKNSNIGIEIVDGDIQLNIPKGVDASDLIERVKANKSVLLEYLGKVSKRTGSIPRSPSKDYYGLSAAQRRLHFLYELDKDSLAYNLNDIVKLEGVLDREKLERSFKGLLSRHEILRTQFELIDDEVYQRVLDEVSFEIEYHKGSEGHYDDLLTAFIRPFDLGVAPLFRVGVIELSSVSHVLVVDMHHIITDGVSQGVMIRDFMSLYEGTKLEALPLQYKDYSEWQQSKDYQDSLAIQKSYWLGEYSEEVSILELPTDYPRPEIKSYRGSNFSFTLSTEVTASLRSLGDKQGATLFMTLLSIFNVLLSKLSGQQDVVVGTGIAGRSHADLEDIVGMFVNTLALRNYPKWDLSFSDFLVGVKDNTLQGLEYQHYPYEELVSHLDLPRDTSRNPLFDVMFVLQNFEREVLGFSDLEVTSKDIGYHVSKFDLTLNVLEHPEDLELSYEYSTDLFKEDTIARFADYFKRIVDQVISNPDIVLGDIVLLDKKEEQVLLADFNATSVAYPKDKTIIDLFYDQVKLHGSKIALEDIEGSLSYEEVYNRAQLIASFLIDQGHVNSVIGIIGERSSLTIVGILGILMSGSCYLPIDGKAPLSRTASILEDGGVSVVLGSASSTTFLTDDFTVYDLDTLYKSGVISEGVSSTTFSPDSLAYVMYTSGSTGLPKGVKVSHGNVVRLVKNPTYVSLDATTRILLTGSLSFDASTFEVWGSLLNGGTLYLVSEETLLDTDLLGSALLRYQITTLWLTSSLFNYHVDKGEDVFSGLSYLLIGGEALSPYHINKVKSRHPDLRLINGYGPTENTTFTTTHLIEGYYGDRIPIGKPIGNTEVYILDSYDHLSPIGVIGELCIGGAGLARGYLNNVALTEEKFIDNPYREGEKMYRSGDLCRWLPDGNIEFIGRKDSQIKLRGYRIELGEIEHQVLGYTGISDVVVVLKGEDESDAYLVCYYVCDQELLVSDLRSYLLGRIPDYMVPGYYVAMERIPLTSNGKVDRNSLPSPEISLGDDYVGASTAIEEELVTIWSDVLGIEEEVISVTRSFFELGGNSLRAMVLVNKVSSSFEVDFALRDVFRYADIRSLGVHLLSLDRRVYHSIPLSPSKAMYSLSSAQRRMYFLHRFDSLSLAYNMPEVIRLEGVLDMDRLRDSFVSLLSRHELLRTVFVEQGGDVYQRVLEAYDFVLEEYDLSNGVTKEDLIASFIRPFDLGVGPMLRVGIIQESFQSHLLLIDMHHIVSDGVSHGILVGDFIRLYEGDSLEELSLQYRDYSEWQQSVDYQDSLAIQKSYWLSEYFGELTLLDLPTDYPRPELKSYAGATFGFRLDREVTASLRSLGDVEGATLFMTLLSVFNVLLGKLGNQEDIIVGTPVAGRSHADLEGVVGMFVNTLALRNYPNGDLSFRSFLEGVKDSSLGGFSNQDYQYEDLVDSLDIVRDTSRNPLFDVMFSYQNFERSSLELSDLEVSSYDTGHSVSKFDLTLDIIEGEEGLFLNYVYDTDLFKEDTIGRFAVYFKHIVDQVISNPDIVLGDIVLLDKKEEQVLLADFNATSVAYPKDKTLIDLFESRVALHPDQIAVRYTGGSLTYKDLQVRSNQIASYLQEEFGVKKGDIVGLMMNRESDLIPLIFGIMKCGGVYLPLSVDQPLERIGSIISDSGLKVLISHTKDVVDSLLDSSVLFLNLSELGDKLSDRTEEYDAIIEGSDLAYIIYTSGSTGQPKGVMIEHHSIVNQLLWAQEEFGLTSEDVLLQKTPLVFDVSIWELFWWSISGSSLCLLAPGGEKDPGLIIDTVVSNGVTTIHFVPSMLSVFLSDLGASDIKRLSSVRQVFSSGEALSLDHVSNFRDTLHKTNKTRLINLYGPTEATVHASYYECDFRESAIRIPIGKPIANTSLYVIDEYDHLCPIGVVGELCIGGVGLSVGYLGKEELTAEKFVANPYIEGEKMYRTGDLCRWLPDGNIEFIGRKDFQVKLRGYRIELGEIEQSVIES